MNEEEKDLVDRMATYIGYHDIKSLMELVMKAIETNARDKEGKE